jgi:uncharacterized lipoprotein YddW (UPF0748 family)
MPATVVLIATIAVGLGCRRGAVRDQRVVVADMTLAQRAERTVEGRAVWVTRWDYTTADDIRRIVKNAARAHFNMIFFQVRGNATAFYRSSLEPWAWELTSTGPLTTGRDPGFDPLAVAIESAHRRKIELHVWMNVFPGWRGQKYPPPEAGQVWTEHPDWFMVDRSGNKMIARDHDVDPSVGTFYSFLNPAVPAVQDHTVAVFREVAENYDVDGIHLDYCRYPHEVGDYSYDPVSLRRFREETGATPESAPELWVQWRGRQVSNVVHRIARECREAASHLMLTVAVGRDPFGARERMMQPVLEWMAAGDVDAAVPMIYKRSDADVAQSVTTYVGNGSGRLVFAGLMVAGDPLKLFQQIGVARITGANGISVFAYSDLFPEHKASPIAKALRNGPFERRARVPLPPTRSREALATMFDE